MQIRSKFFFGDPLDSGYYFEPPKHAPLSGLRSLAEWSACMSEKYEMTFSSTQGDS